MLGSSIIPNVDLASSQPVVKSVIINATVIIGTALANVEEALANDFADFPKFLAIISLSSEHILPIVPDAANFLPTNGSLPIFSTNLARASSTLDFNADATASSRAAAALPLLRE